MPNATVPAAAPGLPAHLKSRVNLPLSDKLVTTLDPADLPDVYGLVVDGSCLEPEIAHGTPLKFSKSEPLKVGDFAVFMFRPELVGPGRHQCIVKRLVTGLRPGLVLPFREHPESEVHQIVVAEQLNPPRQFMIECEKLLAIHMCLGPIEPPEYRVRLSDDEFRTLARQERGGRRRRT